MIRNISIVWLTFALVLVQAPPKEANGHERNLIRRSLDRMAQDPVIVKVGVLNEETGSFALDLREEDFVIEEDGERQKPTRFLREERPLSILLLVDSSGSMRPSIQLIVEAVSRGLKRMKPDDEVALLSFNDVVEVLQDFTRKKALVEEKLRGVLARRPTLARQALLQAATHMLKAASADTPRLIVVLTDNRPSTPLDGTPEKVVMQQLSASASVVCGVIVAYPLPKEFLSVPKSAGAITSYVEETGGLLETVKKVDAAEISESLVRTIDAYRTYYRIEYFSTRSKRDGKHRRIRVTLSPDARRRGGKLKVLAKRGYYAPNASSDQK